MHGDANVVMPSELRCEIEEDLGIHEDHPNPPGVGPHEDRPQGNARSAGTLGAAGGFTPARITLAPPQRAF
eukprot:2616452-Prymnesium_polylepis.3